MKLKDLRDVCGEAELMIHLQLSVLRRGSGQAPEEDVRSKLLLAEFVLLKAELRAHIGALEAILAVCQAVAAGRYREDWQQCARWAGQCEGCSAPDACDNFDDREPHAVIAAQLAELAALSDFAREWILAQAPYQRQRRAWMFGPGGVFQGTTPVTEAADGASVYRPLPAEEAARLRAARDAQMDRQNESMARRLDQYELNRERLAHLCRVQGDLHEIAAIIDTGMPPQVRPGIVSS
jgi:hypothetical protein